MDARRFQSEQDASLKMANPLNNRVSSDRESALSFGYLFFGRYQRKVTRRKAKAFKEKTNTTSLDPRFRGDDKQKATQAYNHPFCLAIRYASIRFPTPSFPMTPDR
jgi:hypothetical protein